MSFEAASGYQCLRCGEFFGGDYVPVSCKVCGGCENCCKCEEDDSKLVHRCGDCEHWSEYTEDSEITRWCTMIGDYTTPEWYCADFKKKDRS